MPSYAFGLLKISHDPAAIQLGCASKHSVPYLSMTRWAKLQSNHVVLFAHFLQRQIPWSGVYCRINKVATCMTIVMEKCSTSTNAKRWTSRHRKRKLSVISRLQLDVSWQYAQQVCKQGMTMWSNLQSSCIRFLMRVANLVLIDIHFPVHLNSKAVSILLHSTVFGQIFVFKAHFRAKICMTLYTFRLVFGNSYHCSGITAHIDKRL